MQERNLYLQGTLNCSRGLDSGVRREGRSREKSKEEKRERERGRNACELCFQKVIPPTLSASFPNVVSLVNQATGDKRHCLLNF